MTTSSTSTPIPVVIDRRRATTQVGETIDLHVDQGMFIMFTQALSWTSRKRHQRL